MRHWIFSCVLLLGMQAFGQTQLHIATCPASPCAVTAYGSAHTAVVVVQLGGGNEHLTSVTDNAGNTYCIVDGSGGCHGTTSTNSIDAANTASTEIAICNNTVSGATSVTIAGTVGIFAAWVREYSGTNTTTPIDSSGQQSNQTGTTPTGPSLTTSNPNTVIINQVVAANTIGAAGGGCTNDGSAIDGDVTASRTVTATGTYACTWTQTSGAWSTSGIAIKAAGGVTTAPTQVGAFTVGP